jgi:hypothetical protein
MPQALATYDLFQKPSQDFLQKFMSIYIARPPVYGLSISLPLFFFGLSSAYKLALFINGFYFIASLIGIYLLSKVFLSKNASLIASFIFASYGFPLFYLHFVYSETAATTFVVYALFFLAKSNYFMRRRETLFFACSFFFCVMTRWTTPIFIFGGFLSLLISFLLNKKTRDSLKFKQIGTNLFLVFTISFLLPLILYYIPNRESFTSYLVTSSKLSATWVTQLAYLSPDLVNTFSTRSVMFYFNILSQQTIYFFLLFAIGTLLCLRFFRKYAFLLFAFFFAYAFLTFVFVLKDDRYIVPIYPVMATISAVVFDRIKFSFLRTLLVILTIFAGSLNFLGASWGIGPLGQQGLKDIVLPSFIHHPRRMYLTTMVWPPRPNEIMAQEMIDVIKNDAKGKFINPTILNTYTVHPMELDNALNSIQLYTSRHTFTFLNLRALKQNDYADLFKRLHQANYILITNSGISPKKFSTEETDAMIPTVNKALLALRPSLPDLFSKVATIPYPLEKITITIYRIDKIKFRKNLSFLITSLIKIDPENEEEIRRQSQILLEK